MILRTHHSSHWDGHSETNSATLRPIDVGRSVPATKSSRKVSFGSFEVDFAAGELRKFGTRLKVAGQPIEILELLLEEPGAVVTREQIRQRLWSGNTFVDFDHSLNAVVNKLREALGDSADNPKFIETVPRKGYRFIAKVNGTSAAEPVPAPSKPAANLESVRNRHIKYWIVAVAALLLISSVFLYLANKRTIPAPQGKSRITLAVLPFTNLSGDSSQEYFSDGITEELSTQIARVNPKRLGVIARLTASRYKNSNKSISDIGKELGVQYLLEGSVRHENNRVRISAQLIRASDQTHVWAANYDRDLKDILAVQSEVAQAVASEVGLKVAPGVTAVRQVNPDIYRSLLLAKSLAFTGNYEEAVRRLDQLAAKDPDNPEIWTNIALVYLNLAGRFVPPDQAMPKAMEFAQRALALDPNFSAALGMIGSIKFYYQYDWSDLDAAYRRALENDPGDSRSHSLYANYLAASGRSEEALAEAELLETLEPSSEMFSCASARIHYYAGRSDVAVAMADRFLRPGGGIAQGCYWFALAGLQQGRNDLALIVANQFQSSELQERIGVAGYFYGRLGKRDQAESLLQKLEARRNSGQWVSDFNIGMVQLGLGNYGEALASLEAAAKEPSGMLVYLKTDPMYDPLRSNPRFTALMRRVHIPGA